MSKTLLDLINNKNSKGFWYYFKILWRDFLKNLEKEPNYDKSWIKLKINHTFVPNDWDKTNPLGSVAESYKEFKTFKRY